MVSVGRSMESGDNALAKLLQASQEMVSLFIYHTKRLFKAFVFTYK